MEAAIILPLVIAGVAAVICIIVNMYLSLSLQSSMHLSLRNQCGEQAGTIYRLDPIREYEWEKEMYWIRPVIAMEEEREYRIPSLFRNRLTDTSKGHSYLIDDTEVIRILSPKKED